MDNNDAADAKNIKPYPRKMQVYGDLDNHELSTPQRDQRAKPEEPDAVTTSDHGTGLLYPSFYGVGLDGLTKHRTLDSPLSAMKSIMLKSRLAMIDAPTLTDPEDKGVVNIKYGLMDPDGNGVAPVSDQTIRFSWLKVAPDGYVVTAYPAGSSATAGPA